MTDFGFSEGFANSAICGEALSILMQNSPFSSGENRQVDKNFSDSASLSSYLNSCLKSSFKVRRNCPNDDVFTVCLMYCGKIPAVLIKATDCSFEIANEYLSIVLMPISGVASFDNQSDEDLNSDGAGVSGLFIPENVKCEISLSSGYYLIFGLDQFKLEKYLVALSPRHSVANLLIGSKGHLISLNYSGVSLPHIIWTQIGAAASFRRSPAVYAALEISEVISSACLSSSCV